MKKYILKIVSFLLLFTAWACDIQLAGNSKSNNGGISNQNQYNTLRNRNIAEALLAKNDLAEIKKLCDADPEACLKQKDSNGNTLLKLAINSRKYDIAKYLVKIDPKTALNTTDNEGKNGIFSAIKISNYIIEGEDPKPGQDFALSLVQNASKEQLEAKDNKGESAVSYIFSTNRIELAEEICKKFPEVCGDKNLLLTTLNQLYQSEIKKLAIDKYFEIHKTLPKDVDEKSNNILQKVISSSYSPGIAEELIEKADISFFTHKNNEDENAILAAIHKDNLDQIGAKKDSYGNDYKLTSKILHRFPTLIHEPFSLYKHDPNRTSYGSDSHSLLERARTNYDYFKTNLRILIFETQYPTFDDISVGQKDLSLPADNWFVKLYEENPFKDLNINIPRPSIWGFELVKKEENNGDILYEKSEKLTDITPQTISENDFNNLFAPQIKEKNKIADGIYSIKKDGVDFVIKTTKTNLKNEYFNLERLQFTAAVVKTYGYFVHGDDKYMILEKGQKSLFATINDKQDIDPQILLEGADNLIKLNNALKFLEIKLNDIKPGNLILTQDNQIKAIDLDTSDPLRYTKGYQGVTSGNLFAQSLTEAFLKRFIGPIYDSFKKILDAEVAPTNPELAKKLLELYNS